MKSETQSSKTKGTVSPIREDEDTVTILKNKMEDAGEQAHEFYDRMKTQSAEQKEKAKTTIRQHPFLSTAAAFGAGMLVTALFSRRN